MCSRAGPPSAQWSRGPSLGLDSGRRHMDYRTEGNMDFVVQHQLKLTQTCVHKMTKDFVLGDKEKVVVSQS